LAINGYGSVTWPACGEIDIMEYWGSNVISSAVHHPINGNLSVDEYVANYQYKEGVTSDFHIYALEWSNERITLSVDGINHLTYEPLIKNQFTWPFDAEQYILLNIAILSNVPANFIQSTMEIDYVRVYQEASLANTNFQKSSKIKFFPNPVSDKLTILNIENTKQKVEIFSIIGKKLFTCSLLNNETNIDVSSFQNGIYLIKIISETGNDTYKFIKE